MVNYRAGMTRDRRLHIPYSFSVVLINARLTFSPRRKKEKEKVLTEQERFTLFDFFLLKY